MIHVPVGMFQNTHLVGRGFCQTPVLAWLGGQRALWSRWRLPAGGHQKLGSCEHTHTHNLVHTLSDSHTNTK